MTGTVDQTGRAIITASLQHPATGKSLSIDAWVDTGFNGDLVLPREMFRTLGLPEGLTGRAILADGSEIDLITYVGALEWFDEKRDVEVIANDGQMPLLGVALLLGHRLVIDYKSGDLSLD